MFFQSLILTVIDHVTLEGDKLAGIYNGVRSVVGSELVGQAVLVHEAGVAPPFVIGIPEHDVSTPFSKEAVRCLFPLTGRSGCIVGK